jgi:hypothetical protein
MRFRITGPGWRLGDALVPADTIIDFAKRDQWSQRAKGKEIPIDALPLDQEAWESQLRLCGAQTPAPRRLDLN